jgi:hypothetical protein
MEDRFEDVATGDDAMRIGSTWPPPLRSSPGARCTVHTAHDTSQAGAAGRRPARRSSWPCM